MGKFYGSYTHMHADTITVQIYVAGDYAMAREALKAWCDDHGDCWSLVAADYIYSGGCEPGVCATRINYPRFPISGRAGMAELALEMAYHLIERLHQSGCTIVGQHKTTYITRHPKG